jgi:hypothetical protein
MPGFEIVTPFGNVCVTRTRKQFTEDIDRIKSQVLTNDRAGDFTTKRTGDRTRKWRGLSGVVGAVDESVAVRVGIFAPDSSFLLCSDSPQLR